MKHYRILGVAVNASKPVIKNAYIEKAKMFHPDLNKSSTALKTFRDINEAYTVLMDDDKRSVYDMDNGIQSEYVRKKTKRRDLRPERSEFDEMFYRERDRMRREYQDEQKLYPNRTSILWFLAIWALAMPLVFGKRQQQKPRKIPVVADSFGRAWILNEKGIPSLRAPHYDDFVRYHLEHDTGD